MKLNGGGWKSSVAVFSGPNTQLNLEGNQTKSLGNQIKVSCCSRDEKADAIWWVSKPKVNLAYIKSQWMWRFLFDLYIWDMVSEAERKLWLCLFLSPFSTPCSLQLPLFGQFWLVALDSCYRNSNITCLCHKTSPYTIKIRSNIYIYTHIKRQKYLCFILKMQWNQGKPGMKINQAPTQDRA